MRIRFLFFLSLILTFFTSQAQVTGDSATAAGGNFNTSNSRAFWMGRNYRAEWNTPITVPVLNMSKEKGGLTPVRRGGGKQTKSLRVKDASGREYSIRSITKFITSKTLPAGLESEAAADLVQDGVSASYPYSALSMTVLSEAAGVPHGNPRVMYIGDDPNLGEFREDFKNMLVLYEERYPDSVKKGFDTDEVVEKLKDDNDNAVDQRALLRVRILDMFVMDLDRHEDQWNWGAWDNGKGKTYYPIAKDRDQAFYINRGILPGFVKGRSLVPQLEGFKAEAKSIERFNFAARNLDRFFLNELGQEVWKQEAELFVSKMTDEVIDRAIAQQPKEIRDLSGPWIAQTLKARRNFIVAEVMDYYYFLAHTVSITGSDKREQYSITRNDDGSMVLVVNKITNEGNISTKMYERKFDPFYTKEVRIYGFGGDDKFIVSGSNDKVKTRLIGGDGADLFENTSKSSGAVVYDRADGNNTITGSFKNKQKNDTIVNSYDRLGYKYPYQSFFATVGFNPDDGILIGPTLKYIRHGFRKSPYKSMHQIKTLFAFSTRAFRFTYNNEFIGVFGKNTDLTMEVDYRGPNNTSNFFGYGMNTVYNKNNPGKFRYYRIRYDLGDISMLLRHRFSPKVMLWLGPTFQFYHYDSTDKFNKVRNVEVTPPLGLASSINNRQSYFGGRIMLTVDTRDNTVHPGKGILWNNSFKFLNGTTDKSYDNVSQFNTDFTFHLKLAKEWLIWANRTGFGATMGDGFEFYQAQTLGSNEDLRGYRRERWAGKTKFFNQTELRWKWANLKTYLFPASIGMFVFMDVGRVWVDNDNVSKMASGYGGGFWFSPLKRLVINASVGFSSEDMIPMFGFFWRF